MTTSAVTSEEQRSGVEAVGGGIRDRLQQFLAFASLIAIFLPILVIGVLALLIWFFVWMWLRIRRLGRRRGRGAYA